MKVIISYPYMRTRDMIEYRKIAAKYYEEKVSAITCDVCGTRYTLGLTDSTENQMITQEFLCVNQVGGYAAPFGDMVRWSVDICPKCLPKVLGDYVRLENLG